MLQSEHALPLIKLGNIYTGTGTLSLFVDAAVVVDDGVDHPDE